MVETGLVNDARVMSKGQVTIPKNIRAALNAHADLFLTGDKDFLESSITDPRIINVSDFLEQK